MATPLFSKRRDWAPLIAIAALYGRRHHAVAAAVGFRSARTGQRCVRVDDKMNDNTLIALAGYFALLSLFAVGGANAAIPEMHRIAVEVMHWMTDRQFADSFAISQVSPGPNIIIVTLIGYHVAGLVGAAVATAAMCGPTCVLAFLVARTWDRFKEARWRIAIQAGLVPVSLGLIAASAFVLARSADHNIYAAAITTITAIVGFATRINPLWIFAAGGALGLSGWL
jgi:chromate transporter